MLPLPPGLSADTVSLRSVEIALSKLNIKVPFEDIVSVIREEEAKLALHRFHPPGQPSGFRLVPTSEFILNPPEPSQVDPLAKERRRRLIELTKEAFPDGRIPGGPYSFIRPNDVLDNQLSVLSLKNKCPIPFNASSGTSSDIPHPRQPTCEKE